MDGNTGMQIERQTDEWTDVGTDKSGNIYSVKVEKQIIRKELSRIN